MDMTVQQNINWDKLKETLYSAYSEHKAYIREFKLKNFDIVLVTKYTHTDYRIQVLNSTKTYIISNIKIGGPEECFNKIYELVNG